jgi:DNA-directed RNA polymerase specialized sigma subunit
MNMAEEKKDVFARVRREVREKEEKEAERMRRFNELLRRENTDDELSKKLGR